MLDKRKIKLMSELALYEQNQGNDDIKISDYYRKDYVSFHTISTGLWVTVGYILVWGLIGLCMMDTIIKDMSFAKLLVLLLVAVVGYVVLIIGFLIFAHHLYNAKHKRARQNVRKYNHVLIKLLRTYERENKRHGKASDS